jgi:hypothetical protein
MRGKILIVFLATISSFAIRVAPVSAELFVDAYVGPAFTEDGKFENGPAAPATTKFDTVVSGGARLGYFFDAVPFIGFAIDGSHYQPDGKFGGGGRGFDFDSRVTGLSFDLMGRLPLMASNNFPNGQLQPYLTIGPGIYFSRIKITPTPFFGNKDSDGGQGRGGNDFHDHSKHRCVRRISVFSFYSGTPGVRDGCQYSPSPIGR